MSENIENIIEKIGDYKVLVIGEAMLDVYLTGESKRICREAPVPIVDVQNILKHPGGAANTALNLARLGAETVYVSVVGDDEEGEELKKILSLNNVNVKVLKDPKRNTLTKKRVIASDQLLVRYDQGSMEKIDEKKEDEIIDILINSFPKIDAIIISDYVYGILTERIIDAIKRLQKHFTKILVVDAKNLAKYKDLNPDIIKPNYQEAIELLNMQKLSGEKRIEQMVSAGERLAEITGAKIVALTIDMEGSLIFENGKKVYQTFTNPVPNSKAAGAGDTYTSAFALSYLASQNSTKSSEVASAASSVVIQKTGTATCTKEELKLFFSNNKKELKKQNLVFVVNNLKKEGRKIVFTNGCFDILHSGHVEYLNKAKQLGDILIVGVNTDASIKRLKGESRPINSLKDRIRVLSALSSVDYIVPFSTNTPIPIIKKIKPEVFVKGGDYTMEKLPETKVIEEHKGKVIILPFVKDRSTTSIIRRIQRSVDSAASM